MINSKVLSAIALLVLLCCNSTSAKDKTEKFGKLSAADFATNSCPIDSSAHAYFVFDHGSSIFTYPETKVVSNQRNDSGFRLEFTRHFRIKICDNQGYDWADIEIPLYHRSGDDEKISRIRAYTYNLEDGKLVKTKLDKDDINIEASSKNWNTYKAALPNVREGSIIEVQYTVTSEFYFNLRTWDFQYSIPVMESEYSVSIPEYFNYNQTQKGYLPIQTNSRQRSRSLELTFVQKAEGSSQPGYTSVQKFDYQEKVYEYSGANIPAFPREKYLKTAQNYLSRVSFELASTRFPNATINSYTTSWKEINDDLMKHTSFGREIAKGGGHLKTIVAELQATGLTGDKLAEAACNKIKEKMAWTDYASIYASESLSSSYKKGSGNCADINLNLVLLLRKLGLDAFPVLLSTQKHGIIYPVHPSITSFNYVVAQINYEGKEILFDATDPYSEPNILPIRCLNDKGFVISKYGGTWLEIMDNSSYVFQEYQDVKLTEDFEFKGNENVRLKGYAAYLYKRKIKGLGSVDDYRQSLCDKVDDLVIDEINVKGLDATGNGLVIQYAYNQSNSVSANDEIVYFKPLLKPFVNENPFKLKERKYPVEFNYPMLVKQVYNIQIPDGYEVSELPKSFSTRSEDNSLAYKFSISNVGNRINLAVSFSVKKSMFLPEEYSILKQTYQAIMDKQHEMVVLKRVQ